jgi:pimeloyl-ACP methyl ester carboxylesterase
MNPHFITVNGLQIAYYQRNPEQTNIIFFIHGNSGSSGVWRKQVENDLLNDYRLIAIDLPNHGKSSAIRADGDFSLPAIAKIMGTAISQLADGKPFIICGVSLGTNIVAEMLTDTFQPKGLLMAGPCVVGKGFELDKIILPGADVTAVFAENLPETIVTRYAGETSISPDDKDRESFLTDYYAVKGNFRSSLYASIAAGKYSDEIELLQKMNVPVCIIFGKDEKVVNTEYLNNAPINLWNQTIYTIPGASHLVNIDAPEPFNQLLAAFAKEVF